jgi:predicted regulator of Ras-like GTPase activity (Roadblock/LC7/MglB family)
LIYLDKEESSEILDFVKAKGIPHYVLIDKDGVMVESEAPGPETGAIIEKIDHLLEL